jgi:oligopeptide transport system substrate-binding protein
MSNTVLRKVARVVSLATAALLVASSVSTPVLPAAQAAPGQQTGCRTFRETGKAICGQFLQYWQRNGGLAQQGYPISSEFPEISDLDGKLYLVQYFERAVFEHHPENRDSRYQVLLSQLGTFQHKKKYPNGAPNQKPNTSPGSMVFKETGKRVGGKFLAYWQKNGGLAQQGYPISEEFAEVSDLDGKTYTVQYFERAVFEMHPENKPPYDVLLSQLGTFQYRSKYPNGDPILGTGRPTAHVLRYNQGAEPDTIDPQQLSFIGEVGIAQLIFEGLMGLNGKLEAVPAAAEKMEVSGDGLKYTFTMRAGLKYSDGKPLNARNFEYAWKRLFDPRVPNRQYSSIAYDIVGAEELDNMSPDNSAAIEAAMGRLGVKATDDMHIEFTLKNKAVYFPYVLTLWTGWPSRQDLVEAGGEDWTTHRTGRYYIGNGPYVLKEYNPPEIMRFEANPNYRLGAPKVKELRAYFANDGAIAFEAYKKGELDVHTLATDDFQTAKNDPGLSKELVQVAGNCTFYIGFNVQKPPFDNVKVRQAFAQAFDRQEYVDEIANGLGKPALSFIPPEHPGHAPDIKMYEFNADAARKTLADAGFPNGQGLPEVKLTYSATPRNKTRFEWIQAQLRANLGVRAQLDPVESSAYTALLKNPRTTPQVFFLGWCQDYPDPQNWLTTVFHSTSTVTHVGWKNQEFDTLTKQADAEPDPAKRMQMYHQAHEVLVREAPVVFLYWDVANYLIKPYVQGMREHVNPQDVVIPGFFNIQNIDVTP